MFLSLAITSPDTRNLCYSTNFSTKWELKMTTIILDLPDDVVERAQSAGLFLHL